VQKLARSFNIAGSVRNLKNGKVEVKAEGTDVDLFISSCLSGYIAEVESVNDSEATQTKGFAIFGK